MEILVKPIEDQAFSNLLEIEESHFVDLKSVDISPSKLTKTVSAFCNSSGGEIYVGIDEFESVDGKRREWRGFVDQEAINPIIQVLEAMLPLGSHYTAELISTSLAPGLVLRLTIFKTQQILKASDTKIYVRSGAQSLPIKDTDTEAIERLRYDKGINSFENELVDASIDEITNSEIVIQFLIEIIPAAEPDQWLEKQRLIKTGRPTVAGTLLFSDLPQTLLPKRSAVKILRYKTRNEAERDFLVSDPVTVEGPIYSMIYEAVEKTKSIIEEIEKLGPKGMEKISYPQEALHEILTNAVLHRDYSIKADIKVRIFDNRIEIESPGRLPGHVTAQNITKTQLARNPQIVRLINKFRNAPNKDVGEGMRTAFEAMNKLRLKKPVIYEGEAEVVITLKHENLGSPEQLVLEYIDEKSKITNSIGRDLTGIRSENAMKDVFIRLRDRGVIEPVPGLGGNKAAWQRKTNVSPDSIQTEISLNAANDEKVDDGSS